jgi:predicted metal-dependent hydrolase
MFKRQNPPAAKLDDITVIALPDGREATLRVRRSERARRLAIRILPNSGTAELVLPKRASMRQGINFAKERADWLQVHLAILPTPIPFADGAIVPLRGRPLKIQRIAGPVDEIRCEGDTLIVQIARRDLSAAVRDYLRGEAKRELRNRATEMAAQINRPFRRLTVRDTSSRWGSCSWQGDLSFSWRLILAPEPVIDYMVAHEVSHLAHMDHSSRFWRQVEELVGDVEEAKGWLREHGVGLHRYGAPLRS